MTGYGTVGGFVLVFSVGRNKHGSHHRKGAESGRDHIAHNVAVVVLASPDESALAAHHAGNGIINKGIEILDAGGLESGLVILLINFLEDSLEPAVVLLGNSILGGEPEVLLYVKGIFKAGVGEAADGSIGVVHTFDDSGACEFVNHHFFAGT